MMPKQVIDEEGQVIWQGTNIRDFELEEDHKLVVVWVDREPRGRKEPIWTLTTFKSVFCQEMQAKREMAEMKAKAAEEAKQ
tara:strand:- start:276 stop:518 length:243 start_codon:yes stop_codon:yes gene_type:complete